MPEPDALPAPLPGRIVIAMLPPACFAIGAAWVQFSGANVPLFQSLQSVTTRAPDALWAWITDQANILAVAAWMSLTLLRVPRAAAAVLLSWPAGLVLVRGLKYLVDAPRPLLVLPHQDVHVIGVELTTLSFPSGHTATAFAVAAALLFSLPPARRAIAALPLLLLASAIGVSRLAVGAHWPVDVLAGAALGWLVGLSGIWWSGHWRFWQTRRGYLVLACLGLLAGILRLLMDSGYPSAHGFAIALGAVAIAVSSRAAWRAARGGSC